MDRLKALPCFYKYLESQRNSSCQLTASEGGTFDKVSWNQVSKTTKEIKLTDCFRMRNGLPLSLAAAKQRFGHYSFANAL